MNGTTLAQLHDIHLPTAVGWWPPAPGWWLAALLLMGSVLALWYAVRRYRRHNYRRLALAQARASYQIWERDGNQPAYLDRTSQLLKRAALAAFPQEQIASLSGKAWLAFLDSRLRQPCFTRPPLDALAHRYSSDLPPLPPSTLHAATIHWIRRHRC